jgi:hypothetical protein
VPPPAPKGVAWDLNGCGIGGLHPIAIGGSAPICRFVERFSVWRARQRLIPWVSTCSCAWQGSCSTFPHSDLAEAPGSWC